MASRKRSLSNAADGHAIRKDWDEASCLICMDHPHNAVLLLCSSHDKGCRSYICDTSYRHSNCLDRFKKIKADDRGSPSQPRILLSDQHRDTSLRNLSGISDVSGRILPAEAMSSLKCPLCRGEVLGWEVVEEARKYLNSKSRSCSHETCSFSGSYEELRRHARRIHPSVRPSDIDPGREQAWRHLEHQRDYGDIISAIHTAMPGSVVIGDYVVEDGDRASGERERSSGEGDRQWRTSYFLFHMLDSVDRTASEQTSRRLRNSTTRHHRSSGSVSGRHHLWGRNLLGTQNRNGSNDTNEDASSVPRRCRRLTRYGYRSVEDRS